MADYEDERDFVAEFMEVHMGEFLGEVACLDDVETVEELEDAIARIRALVRKWPRSRG